MDLPLTLDDTSPTPLNRQLYEALRQAILSGRLARGERLPATRALAHDLAVSRTTVSVAYDQLLAEGYVVARTGAGTFVSSALPDGLFKPPATAPAAPAHRPPLPMSAYGVRLASAGALRGTTPLAAITFGHYGRPALDAFPIDTWRRLMLRHVRSGHAPLGYAEDALGHAPLREALAAYLQRSRAVRCTPDQIVIVGGSQQGLDLIARLLVDAGDGVALEEPGYLGARHAFEAAGARLVPVPVDDAGLRVDQLPSGVKLALVTPSHQFPTGVVLSLPRRLALLDWARTQGALIVEDDYDSEFRYGDRPIPSLQGLDTAGVVLYLGTFSKVLFPALRLGYLVVPPDWAPLFARAKLVADRQAPLLEQLALTDFIVGGHLERHLRRMRVLYAGRRRCLLQALHEHLGDRVTILGDHAGLHVTLRLRTPRDGEAIAERAAALGVGVATTRVCYLGTPEPAELVLGYADLDETRIEEGVRRLAAALEEANPGPYLQTVL